MAKRDAPGTTSDDLGVRLARSAVLAAAVGVFSKHGIEGTRIEDLLEASKVSRRTFYKYFRSKDEVLAALYDEATAQLVNVVRAAQEGVGPTLEALRHGIDVYLDYHVHNARLLKWLVERAVQSDSPLAARRRWLQDQLVEIAQQTARATTRRSPDPFVFYALIGALEGLSLHLLSAPVNARDVTRAKTVLHAMLAHALTLSA